MKFNIGKRSVGDHNPVFIIAELSANHKQKYEIAKETIKAIKGAGADAVKFQTYTPDTITLNCNNKYFKIRQGTIWDGRTLYDLYKEAYMPWEWQPKLKKYAESLGLICFSSPFDKTAVDFLEDIDVPAYKIASFEITDIPLIEYVASRHKPVIISTGIAELKDIELSLQACRKCGNNKIALLKCTSSYPAPLAGMNLATIPDMIKRFKTIVGLSDHAIGITSSVTAVALGAKIIEKHFILDRKIGGPDASFSLEPAEFKELVETIRDAERCLGKVNYRLSVKSIKSREFSRSLFVVEDVKAGERLTGQNVKSIRPGYGMSPKYLKKVLAKKAKKYIVKGTPLSVGLIER